MQQTTERNKFFDDALNDSFPSVTIAGIEFEAADILFHCDPIAYRVYLSDWDDAFGGYE
jgi:hypothetical protein